MLDAKIEGGKSDFVERPRSPNGQPPPGSSPEGWHWRDLGYQTRWLRGVAGSRGESQISESEHARSGLQFREERASTEA